MDTGDWCKLDQILLWTASLKWKIRREVRESLFIIRGIGWGVVVAIDIQKVSSTCMVLPKIVHHVRSPNHQHALRRQDRSSCQQKAFY